MADAAARSTVYVSGFPAGANEQQLLDAFVTFGDILEIKIPNEKDESRSSLPPMCPS